MKKRTSKKSLLLYATLQMYGFKKYPKDYRYRKSVYRLKVRDSLFSPVLEIHRHKAKYSYYSLGNMTSYIKISDTSVSDILNIFSNYPEFN